MLIYFATIVYLYFWQVAKRTCPAVYEILRGYYLRYLPGAFSNHAGIIITHQPAERCDVPISFGAWDICDISDNHRHIDIPGV